MPSWDKRDRSADENFMVHNQRSVFLSWDFGFIGHLSRNKSYRAGEIVHRLP